MARQLTYLLALLLSICITLSAVHSTPVHATNVQFDVEADARVESAHSTTNYGKHHRLSADGSPRMESYLRFNVQGFTRVESAQLQIWTTTSSAKLPTVGRTNNNWSEQSITWNKRPARSGSPISIPGKARSGQWVKLDITKLIDAEGTYTLVLAQDSSDGLSFDSREADHPARLVIVPAAASGQATATATASATSAPTVSATPAAGSQSAPTPTPAPSGTTYYVAKTGSNGDARSWDAAWSDLDRIVWSRIQPGDLILIKADTYTSRLKVGASGTASAPISIRASGGEVRLFGGRETPLPYCDQSNYAQKGTSGDNGIEINGQSNILIDGAGWNGIKIYGWNYGIQFDNRAHGVVVRNVEIYDNGIIEQPNGSYRPRMHGVTMRGSAYDITFERAQIHDNGADAFHSYAGTDQFTLRESWLYNSRKAPNGDIFNHCIHPDGIQYGEFDQSSHIYLEQNVMGPGLYHAILTDPGKTDDVVLRDVLIYDALTSTIANRTSGASNWTIDHVTSVLRNDNILHLELSAGSNFVVKNSLIVGGAHNSVVSGTRFENNYQSDIDGPSVGTRTSITFRDAKNGDYTPTTNVNGAGSRLTSVDSLLAR